MPITGGGKPLIHMAAFLAAIARPCGAEAALPGAGMAALACATGRDDKHVHQDGRRWLRPACSSATTTATG